MSRLQKNLRQNLHGVWKIYQICTKKKKTDESPTVTLYRDAQNLGWGVHMKDQSIGSNWTVNEGKYHINIKEMLAVKFALNSFVKEFSNLSIKLFIDNTTVISILKTWEPPIIFTSTVFVKKYENGAKTEVFGYSAFILIQKTLWQIDPQGLHTFRLSGC